MATTVFKFDNTKEILANIARLNKASVTVGVHSDAKDYDNGTSVAEVAFFNEFGTKNIPERSFLRATFDKNKDAMVGVFEKAMSDFVTKKRRVDYPLRKIGFMMSEKTKEYMEEMKTPPNADGTIKAKQFNNPLIDSRHLKNSINFKVEI